MITISNNFELVWVKTVCCKDILFNSYNSIKKIFLFLSYPLFTNNEFEYERNTPQAASDINVKKNICSKSILIQFLDSYYIFINIISTFIEECRLVSETKYNEHIWLVKFQLDLIISLLTLHILDTIFPLFYFS